MALWLTITLLGFGLSNLVLHGVGIYLLWCLFRQSRLKIQYFYLISLSGSEVVMNFFEVITIISYLTTGSEKNYAVDKINEYILIVQYTGTAFIFHISMIYITLDRLLELLLNIKYPVYWNEEKAGKLLVGTWVTGFVITLVISLLHGLLGLNWEDYFFKYFFPCVEMLFVGLAFTTYTMIFKKFKRTRQSPASFKPCGDDGTRKPPKKQSNFRVFLKSKFFIPVLLISTFLVFVVGADLAFLFAIVVKGYDSQALRSVISISYAISNLLDAWIYIFLQADVRRLFMRKIHKC
jgi:hypothetical protein